MEQKFLAPTTRFFCRARNRNFGCWSHIVWLSEFVRQGPNQNRRGGHGRGNFRSVFELVKNHEPILAFEWVISEDTKVEEEIKNTPHIIFTSVLFPNRKIG